MNIFDDPPEQPLPIDLSQSWSHLWWHFLYELNCKCERAMKRKEWGRTEYYIAWIELVCSEQAAYQQLWLDRRRAE